MTHDRVARVSPRASPPHANHAHHAAVLTRRTCAPRTVHVRRTPHRRADGDLGRAKSRDAKKRQRTKIHTTTAFFTCIAQRKRANVVILESAPAFQNRQRVRAPRPAWREREAWNMKRTFWSFAFLIGCSSSLGCGGAIEPGEEVGSQTAAVVGQWQLIDFPSIPIAAAALPNGKVVTWSSDDRFRFNTGRLQTYTSLFDPSTGVPSEVLVTSSSHDMFCPGTTMMADGRVQVQGGGRVVRNTSTYTPANAVWSAEQPMNQPRWYNSSVTLPDGSMFTLGGNLNGGLAFDGRGEIWSAAKGWRLLPGAPLDPVTTNVAINRSQEHPRLFIAPNGKIFVPGPKPMMHWYDARGEGSVVDAGLRGDDTFSQNDVAVMYDVGKILKAGGNVNYDRAGAAQSPSSATAYVIDINGAAATVHKVASLKRARAYGNGVVLPDGQVLVVGGLDNGKAFSDAGAVLAPELWNPATETWSDVAAMATPRTYHSVALLMPDARVFVAGGGQCGPGCAANHLNAEIYSPPYLFQAGRPQITSAAEYGAYGQTLRVATTGTVTGFAWIRMTSVTHSVNTDQRFMKAAFSGAGAGVFSVIAPPNPNVAPPGYYMLFALNGGVPSIAKLIRVGPANLAVGRPATQSSTYNARGAATAVDGSVQDTSEANVSHTLADPQAWWQVDLGSVQDVGKVNVWTRTDCCSDRLANFDVKLSSDGVTWTSTLNVPGQASAPTVVDFTGARGRYVRVQLRGTNFLALTEVEVFAAKNLALKMPATQSSTFNGRAASIAVDGLTTDLTEANVSHTNADAQAWWQVDLGVPQHLGRVNVWNRVDCCSNRLTNFAVKVSNNGTTWTNSIAVPGTAGSPTTVNFAGATGRFVRVQLVGTNFLSLAEVQVFPSD